MWNRSGGKQVEGARSAASPADAAQGVEVVWMCVSQTRRVAEGVLFGRRRRAGAGRGHDYRRLEHDLSLGHAALC